MAPCMFRWLLAFLVCASVWVTPVRYAEGTAVHTVGAMSGKSVLLRQLLQRGAGDESPPTAGSRRGDMAASTARRRGSVGGGEGSDRSGAMSGSSSSLLQVSSRSATRIPQLKSGDWDPKDGKLQSLLAKRRAEDWKWNYLEGYNLGPRFHQAHNAMNDRVMGYVNKVTTPPGNGIPYKSPYLTTHHLGDHSVFNVPRPTVGRGEELTPIPGSYKAGMYVPVSRGWPRVPEFQYMPDRSWPHGFSRYPDVQGMEKEIQDMQGKTPAEMAEIDDKRVWDIGTVTGDPLAQFYGTLKDAVFERLNNRAMSMVKAASGLKKDVPPNLRDSPQAMDGGGGGDGGSFATTPPNTM